MKNLSVLLATLALSSTVVLAVDAGKPAEKITPVAPAGAKVTTHEVGKVDAAEAFKKLDVNHDGGLSLEEFKTTPEGLKDPVKAPEIFKQMDKDGNGSLNAKEYHVSAPVEKPAAAPIVPAAPAAEKK